MIPVLVALALARAPAPVHVAIDPAQIDPSLAPAVRDELGRRMTAGLVHAGVDIAAAGSRVRLSVAAVDERIYEVEIVVVDGPDELRVHERCEVCGAAELEELVARQAAVLGAKLVAKGRTPATLRIDTRPAGARIDLDDRARGRAPLTLSLAPGPHRVRAAAPGHAPLERRIVAVAGVAERWTAELQPLATPRAGAHRPLVVAGWSALAIGIAALVPGAVFLAIDGRSDRTRCHGSDRDAQGDCRFLYDTRIHGATLTAAGVALTGVGVGLVVAALRRERSAQRGDRRRLRRSPIASGIAKPIEIAAPPPSRP